MLRTFVCERLGGLLLKLDLNLDIRFRGHFSRTFCLFLGSKFGAGVLPLVGVVGVVADVDVVRYLPFDDPFIANGLI